MNMTGKALQPSSMKCSHEKYTCLSTVPGRRMLSIHGWAYEDAQGLNHTLDPTDAMNKQKAEELCNRVVGTTPYSAAARNLFLNNPLIKQANAQATSRGGTLVLWFGPYTPNGDDPLEFPLCAGDDCCCELVNGKLYPAGKAGCAKPPYGTCRACTYEKDVKTANGTRIVCTQKDGVTCPADDVCHVSPCTSMQFECGDICCQKGQTCVDNKKCEGSVDPGVCLENQIPCGESCCNEGEICKDGICEIDPCPQSEGKYWCIQDEVCCAANERCQNGQCVVACPPSEVSCGEECCPENHECKESCGYFYCVPKCAEGETLYCSHDYNVTEIGPTLGSKTDGYTCHTLTSCCDEWKCTKAPLILKDPNPAPNRQLEVPIDMANKYEYCAVEIDGRCGLVSYCDDEPKATRASVLEVCPTCFPYSWGQADNYDPRKKICVGDKLIDIATLSEGVEGLILYNHTDEECNNCQDACPDGQTMDQNGNCCAGTPWGACETCSSWPTHIDECGRVYPMADICCEGDSNAPPTCSGLGNGQCYTYYPINNRSQCCALACISEGAGEEVCCSPSAPTAGGICCESENPTTEECCGAHSLTWCTDPNGGGGNENEGKGGNTNGKCCKEGEECINGECKNKACEDAGGVSGYTNVPEGSQVKDKDGNPIEGCCAKDMACPDECCDADEGLHCA